MLTVLGSATLAGVLKVSAGPNFEPSIGQRFTFMLADSLTGSFDAVVSLDFDIAVEYSDSSASLTVLSTVSTDEPDDLPDSDILEPNYPNPASTETEFGIMLAKPGSAIVRIYDITGRIVAIPISGTLPAGRQTVVMDTSILSSGIYFYELVTNNRRHVRKMIVNK